MAEERKEPIMSTLPVSDTDIHTGLTAALIAVWLSIAILVSALLIAEFAPVRIDHARAEQVISTTLPADPASYAVLGP